MRKHLFILRAIVLAVMLVTTTLTSSADKKRDKELTKQYKEVIERVRKDNSLKKCKLHEENDGRILLYGESPEGLSVYDEKGNCLVKARCPYNNEPITGIYYRQQLSSGTVAIPIIKTITSSKIEFLPDSFYFPHPAVEPSLVVMSENRMKIYDVNGQEKLKILKKPHTFKGEKLNIISLNGLFIIGMHAPFVTNVYGYEKTLDKYLRGEEIKFGRTVKLNYGATKKCYYTSRKNANGMIITTDGRIIAEGIDSYRIDSLGNCEIGRTIDGVNKLGLVSLLDKTLSIPIVFSDIKSEGGQWLVQRNRSDVYEAYDPSKNYVISYQNEGEKLYNQNKYFSAKKFYTSHPDAPGADYFLGMCEYQIAKDQMKSRDKFVNYVNTRQYITDKFANQKYSVSKYLSQSKALLEKYIADAPENDNRRAQHEEFAHQYIVYIEKLLSQEDNEESAYNVAMQTYRQRKLRLEKAMAGVKANQEFVAELKKYQAIVNEGQARAKAKAKASSTSSTSTVKGAKGSGSSEKVDNSGRKNFLRNQITEWKNKLNKNEAIRSNRLDYLNKNPNDNSARRAFESAEKAVNECLEMIRQYEQELQSLK